MSGSPSVVAQCGQELMLLLLLLVPVPVPVLVIVPVLVLVLGCKTGVVVGEYGVDPPPSLLVELQGSGSGSGPGIRAPLALLSVAYRAVAVPPAVYFPALSGFEIAAARTGVSPPFLAALGFVPRLARVAAVPVGAEAATAFDAPLPAAAAAVGSDDCC